MKRFLLILLVLLVPMMVMAQPPADVDADRDVGLVVEGADDLEDAAVDDPEEVAEAYVSGHFWIAVFAGLVLALAFQLLLTGLATALGLSAFSVALKHRARRKEHRYDERRRDDASAGPQRVSRHEVEHAIPGRPIGTTR